MVVNDGPTMAVEPEDDWACLQLSELLEDLAEWEQEQEAMPTSTNASTLGAEATAEQLRSLAKAHTGPNLDVEPLFKAHSALQDIAADLVSLCYEVETMQFGSAAFLAALRGPLQPPQGGEIGWSCAPRALQLFGGPQALPTGPGAQVSTELPSESTDLAGYQKRLNALPEVICADSPLKLSVSLIDEYQDGKDIKRDDICVNGKEVRGANGYDAVLEVLSKAFASADSKFARDSDGARRASQMMLSALNRTTSGFKAFEQVLRVFNCLDAVIVSPDSKAAKPLEAVILEGIALGRAHTRYDVFTMEGTPLLHVDAFFVFRVPTAELEQIVLKRGDKWPEKDIPGAVFLRRAAPGSVTSTGK